LIRARTSEVNRLHKVLEDAGVKLATVATDVMGVSRREMMRALIDGVANPEVLAGLARARLRAKLPELRKGLTARFRDHHAFLLGRMLAHVEALEEDIDAASEQIAELIEPWQLRPPRGCRSSTRSSYPARSPSSPTPLEYASFEFPPHHGATVCLAEHDNDGVSCSAGTP
jgi:hypothetical protein